ncbi:MAG: flavin reductase family protein [Actinomycetota bacterium]|nr:flavin reductase family protein [Actinomycetota bacterium]
MTEPTPAAGPGRAADPGWFRRVLGQYPTGVSVVTGIAPDETPAGLAVGSFTSVSLDPPLVAFLPDRGSSSWPKIHAAGSFCVNILAEDQEPVCRAFASKAADKFAGLGWRTAGSGAPILDDAVAWVDCDLETVHEAGDHLIVIGRVRDLDVVRPTLPLLFFQGGYGRFSPHSLAIRDTRFGAQLHLLDACIAASAGRPTVTASE